MKAMRAGLFMVGAGVAVLVAFWAGAFSAIGAEVVETLRAGPGAGSQPAVDVSAGPGPAPAAGRSA